MCKYTHAYPIGFMDIEIDGLDSNFECFRDKNGIENNITSSNGLKLF